MAFNNKGMGINAHHYKFPYKTVYNRLLKRASKANMDVEFSYEEFLNYTKEKQCYYCHKNINWVPHGKKATRYHLDRKKSNEGYTLKNCVVSCPECNFFKGGMNEVDFLIKIEKIYNNLLK